MSTTVLGIIDRQVAQYPQATALLAPGRQPLSYAALRRHISAVGGRLNAIGIKRNDRVAIVLPNGAEMATAFLATCTIATAAPLNPAYRAEEFAFYLEDLQAKVLLVQSGIASPAREVASKRGIAVVELVPEPTASAGIFSLTGPSSAAMELAHDDDIALVLHTSGTTARPKIVPLTQSNLCASARNIVATLRLTPQDRCLNVMPLFHIHGLVAAILSTLNAGASVVCTPGFAAPQFFGWLDEFRPSWYTAVPTMHQAIVERGRSSGADWHGRLRFVRSSSSALAPQLMHNLEQLFATPVIEAYGMTEAAHQMASNPLPPGERKPGSVGIAAGPEIAIMDDAGKLLTTDERGEIVIRGDNVTPGYAGNPAANARSFTNGWFRTGDQGYLDAQGYLFLTSRLKEIINRGGEKIAPREIDEAMLEHRAVGQAVTFAVPHPTLGEDVAVAVVLRAGETATAQELRLFALQKLATHKAPSQIVIVPEIPKGATGKVQRIGLYEKLAAHMKSVFVAPESDAEKALARIWCEVLRIEKIGIHDNFFALGGDSLRATQVMSRIQAQLQITLPIQAAFAEPTIAGLALALNKGQQEQEQRRQMARMLQEVECLSEEEAKRLLDRQNQKPQE